MRNAMFGMVVAVAVAGVLSGASGAFAQDQDRGPRNGYGVRAGFGSGPDQVVVGAQALLGEKLKYFRLAPSFDVGWGDDCTTYVLNGDLELHLRLPNSRSHLYCGAGAGLAIWDSANAGADTEVGLNLLAGVRLATRGRTNYNLEARFGVSDVPDFRLLVGVLFGSGTPPAN